MIGEAPGARLASLRPGERIAFAGMMLARLRSPTLDRISSLIPLACDPRLMDRVQDEADRRVGCNELQPRRRLRRLLIPLPPLAEQHRIVAKVDALMALCDRLEASLTATAATRRRLLDALLAEALAPVDARELEAAE